MKRVCLFMTLICMMMVSFKPDGSDGKHEGHGYVDLGLSVKWATCNVGATSPEDYGDYFAWGETETKSEYTEENSATYGLSISQLESQGYIDGAGNLNPQYDAAAANWGGDWRMPTVAEMWELINNCTWTWTTQNGVSGYNVEGPNGNSIFLPAAGYICANPFTGGRSTSRGRMATIGRFRMNTSTHMLPTPSSSTQAM